MIEKIKALILNVLPKNAFARGVSVLVGGTAGAQIILVLAAPLLTRIYSPEDYGLLAVFAGLLAVISLLSTLRYEVAIPLPEDNNEAANLVALSLMLVGVVSLLTAGLVFFLGQPVAELLGVPKLADYLWLLPIGLLISGAYNVFTHWSVRTKRFATIAGTKLNQALATLTIQIAAFKLGSLALVLGQVVGQGIGTFSLARPAVRQCSWRQIWLVALRYQRFPKYSTPAGLSRVAGVELPPLVLAAVFSPAAAGLYALTHRVLNLPASLIGGAVSQVFFSNAADAYREGSLGQLVRQVHAKMARVGLPPMLLLILLGPDLFGFVFGENWRQAGEFARWMAPWLYLVFVSSPLTTITAVMERQKEGLLFHLVLLGLRIIAICTGVWIGDLTSTVILLAVVNALWRLVFLLWLSRISGTTVNSIVLDTATAAGLALLCVAPVFLVLGFAISLWPYALVFSMILIIGLYWQLMKDFY